MSKHPLRHRSSSDSNRCNEGGLAKVFGLCLVCLSPTSWSSIGIEASIDNQSNFVFDYSDGHADTGLNELLSSSTPLLTSSQQRSPMESLTTQVESKYLALDLGRLFDISHFYQPNIRHQVVVDDELATVQPTATPQRYEAYFGVAGNRLQYRSDQDLDYSLSGYEIQVGARTNDYFGLEFRVGKSNESEATNSLGQTSTVELDHMISMFARPSLALTDDLRVQAVIGYSSIKRTISGEPALRQRDSSEKRGLSYGLGLQWQWQKNVSVTIDYLNLYDDGDESLDGISIGLSVVHR